MDPLGVHLPSSCYLNRTISRDSGTLGRPLWSSDKCSSPLPPDHLDRERAALRTDLGGRLQIWAAAHLVETDRRFFDQIGRKLTAMLLRCGQATASWIVRQSKGAAAQNFHLTSRNTIESGSGMNESFVSGNHSSMLARQ